MTDLMYCRARVSFDTALYFEQYGTLTYALNKIIDSLGFEIVNLPLVRPTSKSDCKQCKLIVLLTPNLRDIINVYPNTQISYSRILEYAHSTGLPEREEWPKLHSDVVKKLFELHQLSVISQSDIQAIQTEFRR